MTTATDPETFDQDSAYEAYTKQYDGKVVPPPATGAPEAVQPLVQSSPP